jgi:hypothetical protein
MTRYCIITLIIFSSFCFTSYSMSAEVTSISIIEAGIFQTKTIKVEKDNNIATGELFAVDRMSIGLVKATYEVTAKLGIEFGIRYIVNGEPIGKKVPIKIKWIHPMTQNPNTGKSTNTTILADYNRIGRMSYTGHRHRKEGDMPLGKYTIQIFHVETKLAEKEFFVIEPR